MFNPPKLPPVIAAPVPEVTPDVRKLEARRDAVIRKIDARASAPVPVVPPVAEPVIPAFAESKAAEAPKPIERVVAPAARKSRTFRAALWAPDASLAIEIGDEVIEFSPAETAVIRAAVMGWSAGTQS